MRIIADTNVWYELGGDEPLLDSVIDEPITPIFISLSELTLSGNMVHKESEVQAACRAMIRFGKYLILEPPFIYLAKLLKGYEFDGITVFAEKLAIAERLANGGRVAPEHREEFREAVGHKNSVLQGGADLFNNEAKRIRAQIGDQKDEHLAIDSVPLTANFIDFCVRESTNQEISLEDVTMQRFELLLLVLDAFFKQMEVTQTSFKRNDWYDFALLAYVQPGDKLWTREGRWTNLIHEVKLDHYLYEPNR